MRDMLAFKDELVYDLIGLVRASRKSGGCKRIRQEIEKDKFDSNRLLNVGDRFPGKGVGTDHTCVVCKEKRKRWIKSYTGRDMRECPFKESKTTFVCIKYLCIKPEGTCFQVFTKKYSFGYDTFHMIGFQDCS